MARDFWNTKRLAVRIDKIKKSLTIPVASYTCGPINQSLYIPSTTAALYTGGTPFAIGSFSTVTIDFWLNQFDNNSSSNYIICQLISSAGRTIKLINNGGFLRLEIAASGGASAGNTTILPPFHNWTRYTITFSSTTNLAKLYINNELKLSVGTAGNLTIDDFILAFGDAPNSSFVIGYIQDVALYSKAMTQEDVYQTVNHRGNLGVYGSNLTAYWKLRTGFTPTVGAVPNLETLDPLAEFTDESFAPIKFGSSFVAMQCDVSLGYKSSLQFPEVPPDGMTGQFVVRWVDDDDGETQRRSLWELAGVDIGPVPAVYGGEPLGEDFTIEVWNVDGADTLVIPEEIELRVSKTTDPTTSYDVTPVAASVIVPDSTLAANFPLVFPIVFNSQQVYSS